LRAGGLRPGTRLVNRKVAAELGTSTIPVREAIGRLVSEGLLESLPGAGAFVRAPDPDELGELYDVREALETLAAAEAARLASPALVAELRGVCASFREVAATIPQSAKKGDTAPFARHASRAQFDMWLACEEQFHTRVVSAARNRWLAKVVADLRLIADVFAAHRAAPRLLTRTLADEVAAKHEAFVEILEHRDADAARAWMTTHIRAGRDEVLKHMTVRRA
jgi:DNA-binding GntR family transcriptional regulator